MISCPNSFAIELSLAAVSKMVTTGKFAAFSPQPIFQLRDTPEKRPLGLFPGPVMRTLSSSFVFLPFGNNLKALTFNMEYLDILVTMATLCSAVSLDQSASRMMDATAGTFSLGHDTSEPSSLMALFGLVMSSGLTLIEKTSVISVEEAEVFDLCPMAVTET